MGSSAVPQGVIYTRWEGLASRVVAGLCIEAAAHDQRRPAESKSGERGTDRQDERKPAYGIPRGPHQAAYVVTILPFDFHPCRRVAPQAWLDRRSTC